MVNDATGQWITKKELIIQMTAILVVEMMLQMFFRLHHIYKNHIISLCYTRFLNNIKRNNI